MKDSRKIMIRLLTLYVLLATSLMLGGCSTIYNTVMWAPRQLWSVTGDKWFGVHNEQQTEMGPRRRPEGNPQGGGGMPAYPSAPTGNMNGAMPQQGSYQEEYPAQATMPPSQGGSAQAYPSSGMGNYPPLSPSGGANASPYGNSGAPQMQGGSGYPGMPQMPPVPPQYQQSSAGARSPQSMQQMPGSFPAPDIDVGGAGSDPDGMSSDAAYASGGRSSGEAKSKGWSIPFISGNYKMERKFEPLSEQFVVAKNEIIQPEDGEDSLNKEKAKRSSSMFPLDQYAPKPTIVDQPAENKENNTYPKLGQVPQKPENLSDIKASAAELEKMVQESEESQSKKDSIHNLPNNQNGELTGYPDMKVKDAPKPDSETENKANETEKNALEKAPLIKRRAGPQSSNTKSTQDKESFAAAPGALKDDADIMKEIAPENKVELSPTNNKPEAEKGFFARLHDKIFTPAPKTIWRKSEPPIIIKSQDDSGNNTIAIEEPVFEQSLPAFNMPEKTPVNKTEYNNKPVPDAAVTIGSEVRSNNNYNSNNGSLLPNSRYTDRRKVPQHD